MAKMDLKEFRREAKKRRAGRASGAARYTDELKAFALEHADEAQAEGRSTAQAAADLDLCAVTLYGWQKERRAPKGELRPVVVESAAAPGAPAQAATGGHAGAPHPRRLRGRGARHRQRSSPASSPRMIGSTRAVRVFAYTQPVDMRKGYSGLEGIVRHKMGKDLMTGDLCLFVAKNRLRAKVLLFDGTGLCIYAKRLERGHFARLRTDRGVITMTMSELSLFLEGSNLVGRQALSPPAVTLDELAVGIGA